MAILTFNDVLFMPSLSGLGSVHVFLSAKTVAVVLSVINKYVNK